MTVDFKISATLVARDELSPALEKALGVAMKLGEQMTALTKNMMRASQSFTAATACVDRFSSRSADAFNKFEAGSARAKSSVEGMNKVMADLTTKATAAGKAFNMRSTVERMDVTRHVTIFETQTVGRGAPAPIVPSPAAPSPIAPAIQIGQQPQYLPSAPMLRATPGGAVDRLPSMRMPAPALPMGLPESFAPQLPAQHTDDGASVRRQSAKIIPLPPLPAPQIPAGYGLPPAPALPLALSPAGLPARATPAEPGATPWPWSPMPVPANPTNPRVQAAPGAPTFTWPALPQFPAVPMPNVPPSIRMPALTQAPPIAAPAARMPSVLADASPVESPTPSRHNVPATPSAATWYLPPVPAMPALPPPARMQMPPLALAPMTVPTLPPVQMPLLPPVRMQLAPSAPAAPTMRATVPGLPLLAPPPGVVAPGLRAPLPPAPISVPAPQVPSYLPAVVNHQQRAVANVGANMQPAWTAPASAPRQMRDIGGSSIADQPVRQRGAAPALSPAAQPQGTAPGYPVSAIGGWSPPPAQSLPGAFGQPFMPPPARDIGGSSTARGTGGAGRGGSGGAPPPLLLPAPSPDGGAALANFSARGHAIAYAGRTIENFGKALGGAILSTTADAAEYTHQLELMKVAGMSAKDVAEASAAAWKTSKLVTTSTASENLKMIGELRSILPDVNLGISEAVEFLPQVARLSTTMSSLTGKKAGDDLAYTTLRAVEMMGGTVNPNTGVQDTGRAKDMIEAITQAAIMSHGKVGANDWLGFAQQASAVVKNMDPMKVIQQNAPLIMEMGGKRAGTALTSMNQQVVGGVMAQRMLEDWQKYGLIDSKKVTKTRTGIRLAPGAVKGEDVFKGEGGALDWMFKVFIPSLEKAGLTNKQIADNVIRLFGRQTTQREAGILISQKIQIQRDIAMQKTAWGNTKASDELMDKDPAAIGRAFHAQKTNMMTAIGKSVSPAIQSVTQSMTKLFMAITEFVTAHPTVTKWILIVAAIIAAFAVIFGGILVFIGGIAVAIGAIAAIGGSTVVWVIAGISAAIVALSVAILAIDWNKVFSSVGDFFTGLMDGILGWINKIRSHIPNWLGGIDAVPPAGREASQEIVSWRHANQAPDVPNGPLAQDSHEKMAAAIKSALNGAVVNMDGESVGRLVTGHQGREASRPSTGTSGYDSRLSVLRPDYNGL